MTDSGEWKQFVTPTLHPKAFPFRRLCRDFLSISIHANTLEELYLSDSTVEHFTSSGVVSEGCKDISRL